MKLWTLVGVIMVVSLVLAACAPPEPETIVQTVVVKEPGTETTIIITTTPEPTKPAPPKPPEKKVVRTISHAGDIPTIDPNLASDTSSVTVVEDCYVALTRLDEVTSDLLPGMATKWDISDDGKTYTFHLRNDVPWVKWDGAKKEVVKVQDCDGNDRLVTAYDFEYGMLRALDPATASDYAYVLGMAIEGADDYNTGAITDTATVGIKALDEWTVQVNFLEAAAYNANIIGLWTAMPVPKWVIDGDDCTEARGDRWTEPGFYQSYGPFTMKEWIHDSTLTIVKNPFWPGDDATPQAVLDEVVFHMIDDTAGMAEFEAGNMDWTTVPIADLDRVKADPELSKQLTIAPVMCTYYYGYNTKAAFVDDVRVRRALSMALDRQGLVDNVTKGGQEPAQWFSRPGLAAAPTMDSHPDLGIKYDPDAAKAVLQEYLDEKGIGVGDLDIAIMFNTSSGHQKIAEAIQQMWKNDLGVEVKLTNQEWKVYLKTIRSEDTPQIFRLGWCMDYPDANNFIREVFMSGGSANPGVGGINYENPEWDELLMQAAIEPDPKKRLEMYAEAEQILVYEDAAIIPIYWYTNVQLTKPYVKRTYSVGGHQRYEKWDIAK